MKTISRFGICSLALVISTLSVPLSPVVAYAANNKQSSHSPNHHANERALKNSPDKDNPEVETAPETAPAAQDQPSKAPSAAPQPDSTPAAATPTSRAQDPAGNNGTVKIDRTPFDNHPNNQPHTTCTFQVDFYGFDANVGNAAVIFEMQAPTNKGQTLQVVSGDLTPNIGEDAASGGTDLDASETYKLAFTGTPHASQGFHVKLTVHAPGSQGNDTKHKVFWVQPCAQPVTPQTPGVILGEAASTTRGKVLSSTSQLPAKLPSTGAYSNMLNILGVFAAITAYGATYALQTLRIRRTL